MPKHNHYALTDKLILKASPKVDDKGNIKQIVLSDGMGLQLAITPGYSKIFRFRYFFNKRENNITIGKYPAISLSEARAKALEYRQMLDKGINPNENNRRSRTASKNNCKADSFKAVALQWFKERKSKEPIQDKQKKRIMRHFEIDVFPYIGNISIAELDAKTVFNEVIKRKQEVANETAHRILGYIDAVFAYALFEGIIKDNKHIREATKGQLIPVKHKHHAAVTSPIELRKLLRVLDGYRGSTVARAFLKFMPLIYQRHCEVRFMKWENIDFDNAIWKFKVTKTDTEQEIPLSRQALEILKDLHKLTGNNPFVFSSPRNKKQSFSNNTISGALKSLGIDTQNYHTTHGFRVTARTILEEVLKFPVTYIENQLAHAKKDTNGSAYNRTKFVDDRRLMLQVWADYLDELKNTDTDIAELASKYKYKN